MRSKPNSHTVLAQDCVFLLFSFQLKQTTGQVEIQIRSVVLKTFWLLICWLLDTLSVGSATFSSHIGKNYIESQLLDSAEEMTASCQWKMPPFFSVWASLMEGNGIPTGLYDKNYGSIDLPKVSSQLDNQSKFVGLLLKINAKRLLHMRLNIILLRWLLAAAMVTPRLRSQWLKAKVITTTKKWLISCKRRRMLTDDNCCFSQTAIRWTLGTASCDAWKRKRMESCSQITEQALNKQIFTGLTQT